MHNFKNLLLWQKAIELCLEVYKNIKEIPSEEKYGLISQIKRSAVSIPSNIAEGAGRNTNKEFIYFLSIAQACSFELETELILCNKFGYINDELLNVLTIKIDEIEKMNRSFQQKLNKENIK